MRAIKENKLIVSQLLPLFFGGGGGDERAYAETHLVRKNLDVKRQPSPANE